MAKEFDWRESSHNYKLYLLMTKGSDTRDKNGISLYLNGSLKLKSRISMIHQLSFGQFLEDQESQDNAAILVNSDQERHKSSQVGLKAYPLHLLTNQPGLRPLWRYSIPFVASSAISSRDV